MADVGFTGTRDGLTADQESVLRQWLHDGGAMGFHHGDCVGADAQAHDIAKGEGYWIIVHPPDRNGLRAHKVGDETREPRPYLLRNQDIVDAAGILVACPGEMTEQVRSGTWSTIRYARAVGKPVQIIYPDGSTDLV